jgi:hypothetical protein
MVRLVALGSGAGVKVRLWVQSPRPLWLPVMVPR